MNGLLVNITLRYAAFPPSHGLKHSDDWHDAFWLAHLMRLGVLPTGYIYPKTLRGLRELGRQRMRLVQHRSSHIVSVPSQIWRSRGTPRFGHDPGYAAVG